MKEKTNILSFLTPKQYTFYISDKTTIRGFLEKSDYHKFSVVPVLDDEGKYIGSLSEGDVLRYIKNRADFSLQVAEETPVSEMEHYRSYQSVQVNVELSDLYELLLNQNFVPLVDDRGVFIGIIKRSTVMDFLRSRYLEWQAKEDAGEEEWK